ncbi:hypothetical protein HMPREF0358_4220, partial [Escherichia coli 83972]
MAVTSPVTDFSLKLPEVTFLHRLQGIRDTMKLTVLRGIFPDFPGCRWLPVPAPFKTGSVPLAAESAEPDARLFHKPAIAEPENALAEVNPENATDLPEVFIHVFIPVAVSMMLTVPVAGFSPCRAGKFIQRIHCDGDNAAHLNARPDSVQGDAHQPDIRAKTVLTTFSKHGQHTGNILHFTTGIRFSAAVPAVFAGTEREKTGCRMLLVNTHGFTTSD